MNVVSRPETLTCHVCNAPAGLIYEAAGEHAVSSVYEVFQVRVRTYFCDRCGHLSTPAPTRLDQYYDDRYRIWTRSEEEDQLYRMTEAGPIFRSQHQARLVLERLALPTGARILDFGAAKGATFRHIQAERPDLAFHLFDVSTAYQGFWETLVPASQTAVYQLPPAWDGSFDVACSFYVFEHIEGLAEAAATVRRALKAGGTFFFVVPSIASNAGDFIVVDHVNHFSPTSLRHMLAAAGFEGVEIDETAIDGAYVVTARAGAGRPVAEDVSGARARCEELARYWSDFAGRIRAFEEDAGPEVAIYGSGLYGLFIYGTLRHPERVRCFLDRNPYRQGIALFGRPVLPPEQLPVDVVYVGLNPLHARAAIAQVDAWQGRPVRCFYP